MPSFKKGGKKELEFRLANLAVWKREEKEVVSLEELISRVCLKRERVIFSLVEKKSKERGKQRAIFGGRE